MQDHLKEGINNHARIKPIDEEIFPKLFNASVYIQSSFEDLDGYMKLLSHLIL